MEFGFLMASKYLNVVMDETNGDKKNDSSTATISMPMSKSMKRTLESETTIIPIYKNSK